MRGVLHDLGYSLANLSWLFTAARGESDAGRKDLLELIEKESTQLLRLVSAAGHHPPAVEAVRADEVLGRIVELADVMNRTAVTLTAGGPVALQVDEQLLWRVATNVIHNAVRAAGPDGAVSVSVGDAAGGVVIEVVDDGPGFGRGPVGTAGLGLGLGRGLGIVSDLMDRCDGRVSVHAVEPHGTRMRLEFPDGQALAAEPDEPAAAAEVVLCDDHAGSRDDVESALTARGFTVGAVVGSADRIVEVVQRRQPDVCVVGRDPTAGNGLDTIRQLTAASPLTRIVVVSEDQDVDVVRRALELGAVGYVRRSAGVPALVAAVQNVVNGEIVVHAARPRGGRVDSELADAHRLAGYLTCRERECLGMLVEGLGTAAMTRRLGVSTTTVRTHVQALLTKLGVHSRLEAAAFAVRHSLLDEAPDRPPVPSRSMAPRRVQRAGPRPVAAG